MGPSRVFINEPITSGNDWENSLNAPNSSKCLSNCHKMSKNVKKCQKMSTSDASLSEWTCLSSVSKMLAFKLYLLDLRHFSMWRVDMTRIRPRLVVRHQLRAGGGEQIRLVA